MKNKRIQRFLSLVSVAILLLLIASGCAGTSNNRNATKEDITGKETEKEDIENDYLIVKDGSVTLKVANYDISSSTGKSYTDNLPVWQEVEKRTGVKIEWDVVPSDQYTTQIQTRLAAGTGNLPDIIMMPFGQTMVYAASGVIIPIDKLIEEHAPNLKKYFDTNPFLKALNSAYDGCMYKISSDVTGSLYINPFVWIIRKDWLDALSLNEPLTTDDWYVMAKAFKENDLNKNGSLDEIPIQAYGGHRFLMKFGEPWGLRLFYSGGFSVDKDGKVQYDYISPKFKEMLGWLNKLYKEELIDQEFTSITGTEMWGRVARNVVGAFPAFTTSVAAGTKMLKDNGVPDGEYMAYTPPKGPYGDQIAEHGQNFSGDYAISKDCKHPDIAIKWLDFIVASEEGNELMMYGIEGETYIKENGECKYTDLVLNNPNQLSAMEVLRDYGAWPHTPYIQTYEAYKAMYANTPELIEASNKIRPFLVSPFPDIIGTDDENSTVATIMADMQTYMDEMIVKFIIGQESLDKFDDYVNRIKELKIDDVLKIKQTQYERFLKVLDSN
jgi:putative aldouronate transport system substrate-binding protein